MYSLKKFPGNILPALILLFYVLSFFLFPLLINFCKEWNSAVFSIIQNVIISFVSYGFTQLVHMLGNLFPRAIKL